MIIARENLEEVPIFYRYMYSVMYGDMFFVIVDACARAYVSMHFYICFSIDVANGLSSDIIRLQKRDENEIRKRRKGLGPTINKTMERGTRRAGKMNGREKGVQATR